VLTDEITTFCPHPEDPENKTLLTLEGSLTVNLWGVASAIETAILPVYTRFFTFPTIFPVRAFPKTFPLPINSLKDLP